MTALQSYAMPFIRYRLGDRVSLPVSATACSIPFGAIAKIEGRSIDYLHFPGNIAVSPYEIMDQLYSLSEVRRYQVVQDETYAIQVQSEAPAAADSSIEHRVRDILKPVCPATS